MILDDVARDGDAEPSTAVLARQERRAKAREDVAWNTGPLVANGPELALDTVGASGGDDSVSSAARLDRATLKRLNRD